MKFKTCLLALLFGLVLLVDHFCYGGSYFTDSECTPNDVMNNCNSTDCILGVIDKDKEVIGDERCAVFWEGADEPIPFRVCRKKTNGTLEDICNTANLQPPLMKVKCMDMKYKICSETPPSMGHGCMSLVHNCNCGSNSTGTDDPEASKTCTDP